MFRAGQSARSDKEFVTAGRARTNTRFSRRRNLRRGEFRRVCVVCFEAETTTLSLCSRPAERTSPSWRFGLVSPESPDGKASCSTNWALRAGKPFHSGSAVGPRTPSFSVRGVSPSPNGLALFTSSIRSTGPRGQSPFFRLHTLALHASPSLQGSRRTPCHRRFGIATRRRSLGPPAEQRS